MSKLRRQVAEFHRVFEHPTATTPMVLSQQRLKLRLALIAEEFIELMEAAGLHMGFESIEEAMREFREGLEQSLTKPFNLVEVVDALADLDYVVEGMRLEMGVDGGPIADLVHEANLRKIGGGKRPDGKTRKPNGWLPPDIAGELRRQGWKG